MHEKPIDRRLKTLHNEGSGSFLGPTVMKVFLEPILLFSWIKRNHKHKILKHFLSKNKFPQFPIQF